jgi:hypothetical protein
MCEMFHKLPLQVKDSKTKGRSFVLNGRPQGFVRLKPGFGRELVAQTNARPYVGQPAETRVYTDT